MEKLSVGLHTAWTGHDLDALERSCAPGANKVQEVTEFLSSIAEGSLMQAEVLGTGVGRLSWCTDSMPNATPLLATTT